MSITRRESADKCLSGVPLTTVAHLQALYEAAVSSAEITDNAANLARVIARELEQITLSMRLEDEHSFLDELYARTFTPKGYLRQLLDECQGAGILECVSISGKLAAVPRIPDEARR